MLRKPGILFFLQVLILAIPQVGFASPRDAEKYTHIAGFNLADYYSFDDLAKKFGKSKIVSTGDGAYSDSRVCYKTPDSKIVVIFFRGEVNMGFTVRYPTKMDANCPKSHALTHNLTRISGIDLGMSEAEYKRLVGKPTKVRLNYISHEFHYVHSLTEQELKAQIEEYRKEGHSDESTDGIKDWDVDIWLDALFNHGRLTSFTVGRTEQN